MTKASTTQAVQTLLNRGWSADQIATTKGLKASTVQRIAARYQPSPVQRTAAQRQPSPVEAADITVETASFAAEFKRIENERIDAEVALLNKGLERDDLIRLLFQSGWTGAMISEVCGLSAGRVYQIRDGRR